MTQGIEIPKAKTFGALGSLPLIDIAAPNQSLLKLSYEYGPIFSFQLPGRTSIYVSNEKFVAEACDESRFDKNVSPALQNVRAFTGDGLFTSWTHEPNWKKAHDLLLPSFSQQAMKGYHTMMVDLAVQLVQKWLRLNPGEEIDVAEDMTRLTLDTIGLCGFHYRFNSFYRETSHPFIMSMVRALEAAMKMSLGAPAGDEQKNQLEADTKFMFDLVDEMIAKRKQSGSKGEQDLLGHMLNSKDAQTGEGLSDENIRYQIITFLIAGHETTSGLLSFAVYYVLKHPDVLKKAQEEVDRVLTDTAPTYKQVQQLPYIRMILQEALRLWPTAPVFTLYAKEDTMLGMYPVPKNQSVSVLIPKLHRDETVWGEDAELFRPERFTQMDTIPPHAYKPFGNGQRACIGQQFAMQEATLVLGMLLQYFDFEDHTDYTLSVKETLTMKPDHFKMRVKPRKNSLLDVPFQQTMMVKTEEEPQQEVVRMATHDTPFLVLYGSNLGAAEGIARDLAHGAELRGFTSKIAPLDTYVKRLPKEGVVCIVTASYNGNPPDNAKDFVAWLPAADDVEGVKYMVFGCGNRSWASTYQRIPRLVDEQLHLKGATRLLPRGEGDANDDFEGQYEVWQEKMWEAVLVAFDLHVPTQEEVETISIAFQTTNIPLAKSYETFQASVVENRELLAADTRSTRHVEISLPLGVTYEEGEHIGIFPENRPELVKRALHRFGVEEDHFLTVQGTGRMLTHLPFGQSLRTHDLFTHYVELQMPATRAQLRELAAFTVCPPHKKEIEYLLEESVYKQQVLHKGLTMLDLLEQYPACELPFERFLQLLPPLKPRYYSISSSPRIDANRLSMTVSVVQDPAWSGRGMYKGVASNFLANIRVGERVTCFIRTPQPRFGLPETEKPIIMVGPGTGIAPFRGFLQARRIQQLRGERLGEAHLYFGCRHPQQDYVYKQELEQAERDGLVTMHTAFSRLQEQKVYVQHLIEQDAEQLIRLLDEGGYLYVCGDGTYMAPDVERAFCNGYMTVHGVTMEAAEMWLTKLQEENRYRKDVWAGGKLPVAKEERQVIQC